MFVVVGPTTVDFFVSGLEHIPSFGGDEFRPDNLTYCNRPVNIVLGGNGANSAYVLATLGAQVILSSAVGYDKPGDMAFDWLAEQEVELHAINRRSNYTTSTNTIITDDTLNRISFFHAGASDSFRLEDIPSKVFRKAGVLLLTGYSLLPQLRSEGYLSILSTARRNGAITAFDIGPAIGQPVKLAELAPLLPTIDYLITNDYELAICTGSQDLETGIAQLLESGAKYVVVKQGKDGALVRGENLRIDEPGFAVSARFTVGAGDSFNAGFLYGIGQSWDPARAVRFGNATAALVVSSAQGVLGSPAAEQVEAFVNENSSTTEGT
jgi:sugar/nucleoside kinase (ribokinase family)